LLNHYILCKRNKQFRRGKTTYAHSLSVKIGKLIAETGSKQLSKVSHKDIKKLWSSVRSSTSQRKSASSATTTFSSEDLADCFTDIATDSTYDQALTNDSLVKSIPLTKSFVCCLLIDYSKAFDSINHSILFQKLQSLDLLPSITLWICNFLNGRTQSVSCGGVLSNWKFITASIIQGSGIGPSLFIIYSKDLKPLSVHNTI